MPRDTDLPDLPGVIHGSPLWDAEAEERARRARAALGPDGHTGSSFHNMPSYVGKLGAGFDDPLRALANSNANMNTYNRAQADQTRGAQFALMNQMAGTPSQSALASRGVLSQGASAALNNGGRGALGSAGMLGAFTAGSSGALGALAQQASREALGKQQTIGNAALGMRGRDIQSASANADAQLRERLLNDQTRDKAARLGSGVQNARQQALVELYKFYTARDRAAEKKTKDDIDNVVNGTASALSFGLLNGAFKTPR